MKDSSAPAEERPAAAPWIGPGAMLREARESKRLSTRAVADALHLNTDIVEALEEERFDDLPPLTFVKGYFRAYAKLVELPEEQLMDAFDRLGLEASEPLPSINAAAEGGQRGAPSMVWVVLILVLALAAGLGWWWYNQRVAQDGGAGGAPGTAQSESAGPNGAAGEPASNEVRDTSRGEPSVAAGSDPARETVSPAADSVEGTRGGAPTIEGNNLQPAQDGPDTGVDTDGGAGPASAGSSSATTDAPGAASTTDDRAPEGDGDVAAGPTQPQSEGAPAAEASAEPAPGATAEAGAGAVASATTEQQTRTGTDAASTATMMLTVSGESWVDIREATGGRVLYGLISGPAQRTVSGQPPFTLVIGEARAVELRYEGETVPLEPFIRGDVARFQWPPDS